MKKYIFLTLITFAFFPQFTHACSCIEPSSFCESITKSDGTFYSNLILRGKVTGKTGNEIEVQVGEIVYGNLNQDEIVIVPSFCDLYYNNLEEGNEYLIALSSSNNSFYLIACAISFLKIENEVIKGKIAPGIESLDYQDLATLEDCGDGFDIFSIEKSMSIFPNPTTDILNIKNISSADSVQNVRIEFIDMLGREHHIFKKENVIMAGESWFVDIQEFSAGVYFLKLFANNQETVVRIVKQ